MTALDAVSLGVVLGVALSVTVLVPMLLIVARRLNRARELDTRLRIDRLLRIREEQRSRMRRAVAMLGSTDTCATPPDDEAESERILYSPEAREEIARLNVSDEHVETVLAYPASRARRPADHSIQLERDFGRWTLRVVVAEPWPIFGTAYVKQVERRMPTRGKRWVHTVRGVVATRITRRWIPTERRSGTSL